MVIIHSYATDSNERRRVYTCIFTISILLSFFLNSKLDEIGFNLHWLFDISFFVFLGVFYGIFDQWAWKSSIFKKLGLVKFPNLNGKWKGYIKSSMNLDGKYDAELEIHQTWNRISIDLKTDDSISCSVSSSILTENKTKMRISYEYLNEPLYGIRKTINMHRGTSRLILSADGQELSGDYYNDPNRKSYGELYFIRE